MTKRHIVFIAGLLALATLVLCLFWYREILIALKIDPAPPDFPEECFLGEGDGFPAECRRPVNPF